MSLLSFPVLCLAWILDGGFQRSGQLIKEPLVKAILVFCMVLLLGFLWSEYPEGGRMKWKKYFILLIFIPFLSLLNKERLPWVIGASLAGCSVVLFFGVYQWAVLEGQGIPLFKMSYLSFSAMLGIGIILTVYFAGTSITKKAKLLFWVLALVLLFIQFNQSARGLILATLGTLPVLIYRAEIRKFTTILVSLIIVVSIFSFNSAVFQERLVQVKHDIELFHQGNYSSSVGYRLAMWDVGLDGIARKPWLGHGTGTPESYFENTIVTYKEGIYKDLPKFQRTSHYHNDWIEIGMHLGVLGILTLAFLLWSWCQSFKTHHLANLGAALVCYIFMAGLTDTFLIYSKIPILLLIITAIAICWQQERERLRN
ncbi:MAG: O-antigen ligase family protein [Nitrosomonas sp.]|nr:O-antigen ligase family protein [Nitrosomonas sp.]